MDKIVLWDDAKNTILKNQRWVGFEDVLSGNILDDLEHPNKEKYGHQRILVVDIWGYPYICPYVEDEKTIFLKTLFPDRRYKK